MPSNVSLLLLVAAFILRLNLCLARSTFGINQRGGWTGRLMHPDASSAKHTGFVPPAAVRRLPVREAKLDRDAGNWYLSTGIPAARCRGSVLKLASTSATDKEETSGAVSQGETNANKTLRTLYPPLIPNRNGTLQVDSLHTLYYEEYGRDPANETEVNARDHPMRTSLFLHGGPGAGCFPNHARFFDPARYRIVLFDQRGCGRSSPRGETRNNTIAHLVRDCEALRKELGVSKWDCVLGGSWGVTLALAYAQEYSSSVSSMVLRGICALRSQEVNWLFGRDGGAATLNPKGWREFEDALGIGSGDTTRGNASPRNNPNDPEWRRATLHAYYDCLLGEDPLVRLHAARAWFKWEMGVSALAGSSENEEKIVYRSGIGWRFVDKFGDCIELNSKGQTALNAVSHLRRWQLPVNQSSRNGGGENIRTPRLYDLARKLADFSTILNCTEEAAAQFIPAQAMLTCYYSVNDRKMMQNFDLLSEENIQRVRHIPCIAVQGGQDTICPPDTALDLHMLWPEMELRVPLASGHSMYDPAIASELVKATESILGMMRDEQ